MFKAWQRTSLHRKQLYQNLICMGKWQSAKPISNLLIPPMEMGGKKLRKQNKVIA